MLPACASDRQVTNGCQGTSVALAVLITNCYPATSSFSVPGVHSTNAWRTESGSERRGSSQANGDDGGQAVSQMPETEGGCPKFSHGDAEKELERAKGFEPRGTRQALDINLGKAWGVLRPCAAEHASTSA